MSANRGVGTIVMALGWLSLAACGGSGSALGEIRLELRDDGVSSPCAGAAHLLVHAQNAHDFWEHHEYGQFFEVNPWACAGGTILFSGLEPDNEFWVSASLYDSTTDLSGLLAQGATNAFHLEPGASLPVAVSLTRTDARLGTIRFASQPPDWSQAAEAETFRFSVTAEGEPVPQRSGFLDIQPERISDAFPVVISNLPVPPVDTVAHVVVEARGKHLPPDLEPPVLRTWTATAHLGGQDANPAELVLE